MLNREAILRLTMLDATGQEHERESVVDTGFDGWLTLPSNFVSSLGLQWQQYGLAVLADGSESSFNIYQSDILWDGLPRTILIYSMDAE